MTDPTETPEFLVLAEIEARHQPMHPGKPGTTCIGGHDWPCDSAILLAAYDDRARAFAALAEQSRVIAAADKASGQVVEILTTLALEQQKVIERLDAEAVEHAALMRRAEVTLRGANAEIERLSERAASRG